MSTLYLRLAGSCRCLLQHGGYAVRMLAMLVWLIPGAIQAEEAEEATEAPRGFEHMATGFALRGAHEHLSCDQCHVRGIFKGTPTRCLGCHLYATDIEASKKSPNHIPTTEDCDVCHNAFLPNVSWQLVNMNHAGIVNNCASCHNNVFAPGKPSGHVMTTAPCENCHRSTVSWAGARFDHTGISTDCARCHNNSQAVGKPSNHIPTAHSCEFCHRSTTDFANVRMNHDGITTGCERCHNGVLATGKKANHIPVTASCEVCHGNQFLTFDNPRMDHAGAGIANNCQRCHEAGNPYGVTSRPPPPHPRATQAPDCSACHLNTRSFLPVGKR